MQCASLTLVALLGIQVICGGGVTHHITPDPLANLDCPMGESCLNLSTFAANASNYTDSKGTTLIFLAGNHTLDSDFSVSNVTLLKLLTNCSKMPTITCNHGTHMHFVDIADIEIQNLHFVGCQSVVQSVEQFVLEDSKFHGTNGYGSALKLDQIYAAAIISSSFTFNSHNIVVHQDLNISSSFSSRGGGALAISESSLQISQSQFIDNTAGLGGAIFLERNSIVTINDLHFADNSVESCDGFNCYGGAMYIDSGCAVTACNNTFLNNTSEYGGGAIAVFQATYRDIQNTFRYNRVYYHGGMLYKFISGLATYCSSSGVGGNGAVIFAQNGTQIVSVESFFTKIGRAHV